MKNTKPLIRLLLFLVFLVSATAVSVSAWHSPYGHDSSYVYNGHGGYFYRYGYDSYRPHVSTRYQSAGYYSPTNYVGEHWSYPRYSYGYGYSGYPASYNINYGRPYYTNYGAVRYYDGGAWPNYAQTRYYW